MKLASSQDLLQLVQGLLDETDLSRPVLIEC
jgi:hypothetical protein